MDIQPCAAQLGKAIQKQTAQLVQEAVGWAASVQAFKESFEEAMKQEAQQHVKQGQGEAEQLVLKCQRESEAKVQLANARADRCVAYTSSCCPTNQHLVSSVGHHTPTHTAVVSVLAR